MAVGLYLLLVAFLFGALPSQAARYTLYDALNQVDAERTNEICELVFGSVPEWLDGFFLRQTSGSWGKLADPVPTRIENIFDAIGMGSVYRFSGKSNVLYSNRYYRSLAYQMWSGNGRSLDGIGTGFSTLYSKSSPFIKQGQHSFPGHLAYSPSHTFWKLGTQIQAVVSDGRFGTRINPATMDNDGKQFPYLDAGVNFGLDGVVFNNAAHAPDDGTGNHWSAVYNANPNTGKTRLIVYKIIPNGLSAKREIFAIKEMQRFSLTQCTATPSTPEAKLHQYREISHMPGFIHDIAVTEHFVVIPVSSLLADPCFMFVYKNWPSYVDTPLYSFSFKWRPDKYSTIQLLNRGSKRFYEVRIQPLFIAHIINAFEDTVTGTVILDVLTSNDPSYFAECSSVSAIINNDGFACPTRVERIIVDIPDSAATRYRLTQVEWNYYEKPTINPNYAGKYYTKAYVINKWLSAGKTSVTKLNTRTTEVSQWVPDQNYLLDAVEFVPSPMASSEDDGVLLVAGQNLNNNRGFVTILDAATLNKLAEIGAPDSTPPGGHSEFYFSTDLGMAKLLSSAVPVTLLLEKTATSFTLVLLTTAFQLLLPLYC